MYWVTTAVFVVLIFHVSCVSQIVLEQVPRLRIDRARLIKEAKQDMWEMFDSKAEVFIQCSSDGGETWPMRVDLESVDSVGRWYEGPWELGEWKYEYGSILYCQVLEDDQALPNFFSFFDTIIDPNDLMGDTVIFMSDFIQQVTKTITFYWREDVVDIDRFPKSMQIELSCIGCQGLKYHLPSYWSQPTPVWPEKIKAKCRFVQGIKAARLLSKGYCCQAGNYLLIGDGYCSDLYPYKSEACGFDFGDCCPPEQKDCWNIEGFNISKEQFLPIFIPTQFFRNPQSSIEQQTIQQQCMTLDMLAREIEDISTFVQALQVTGLYEDVVLGLKEGVTLLAPTNKAFDLVTNELKLSQEDLFDLQSNINTIKEVTELHIIPQVISNFVEVNNATSLSGVGLFLNDQQVETEDGQSANFVPPGVPYEICQGAVIVLEQVLVP
eukprot:TRINITY_DN2710_c1_g1_i6.p1 TRINITY_DN2710_c1_g1~~TRINITY_DN2710_c1_g1_i6.p1  ORF type:complete len:437 (-),score=53.62 TRINITY_DN2710_c1_g1_i6:405-1715(-)